MMKFLCILTTFTIAFLMPNNAEVFNAKGARCSSGVWNGKHCTQDDKVDVGNGWGSCLTSCDCTCCAPFCNKHGFCKPMDSEGSKPCEHATEDTTVVILGGGAAGIAAAKTLHEANIKFVLLEARNELGGRIKNQEFNGYIVEDGANFIHGSYLLSDTSTRNPLYAWKKRFNMTGSIVNYTDMKLIINGKSIDKTLTEKYAKVMDESMKNCTQIGSNLWDEAEALYDKLWPSETIDISVKKCLYEQNYYLADFKIDTKILKALTWEIADFETAIPVASLMWNLPYNTNEDGEEYITEDLLVTDRRGFNIFLKEIAKDFKDNIKLEEQVVSVNYSDSMVKVETEKGMSITGKYVICTLPLGVLQHGQISFSPPFSSLKEKGIHAMTMANYAKVSLAFPNNFWGGEEILMGIRKQNGVMLALNLDHPKYFPGSNILQFHFTDETAKRMESQPVKETKKQIMRHLRSMFGKNIPKPDNIHVTNWTNNPFSYGSYSAVSLGYTENLWEEMRNHEENLYFAGEHTAIAFGFVHSAFETGISTAETLIKELAKD